MPQLSMTPSMREIAPFGWISAAAVDTDAGWADVVLGVRDDLLAAQFGDAWTVGGDLSVELVLLGLGVRQHVGLLGAVGGELGFLGFLVLEELVDLDLLELELALEFGDRANDSWMFCWTRCGTLLCRRIR